MKLFIRDLLSELDFISKVRSQKDFEYLEWINSDLVSIVEEFVKKNRMDELYFVKGLNINFNTDRFGLLLKRWCVEYYLKLFRVLDGLDNLMLEDNPLNRFGVERYHLRFKNIPQISWRRPANIGQRLLGILVRLTSIFYLAVKNGFRFFSKKETFKVMREATWGLYDIGGRYFHDDLLVDGHKIKQTDLLLFSRSVPNESGRLKGYQDAKRSPYRHFDLLSVRLSWHDLFSRIIPKYIFWAGIILSKAVYSNNFSLYWSIYSYFVNNAIPYEKVFSNFNVLSEFGHSYFSTGHIAESIVCQSRGTKYYLMHWSDNSVGIDKYLLSFLGCDGFLIWGRAHLQGVEGNASILISTGYVFKRFINEVKNNRQNILKEIDISPRGNVISFFDESFGGECKMTGEHYVTFWETALKLAQMEDSSTILVRPKDAFGFNNLASALKEKFLAIKGKLETMPNVFIIDSAKWSFIECIGISDIVVSQGMTSSSTIAIICGIEGLYLDQAYYSHPFSKVFKERLVFDDQRKLIDMIHKIIRGEDSPLKDIPEETLRAFDEYPDDRGIDLFRDILSGNIKRRIGIIVQARMSSTRLPGKVMKPILGSPLLEILIKRLRKSKLATKIIIAMTTNEEDNVIEQLAKRLNLDYFRGSEEDVLSRYYGAAKRYGLDVIVRITSDCPFADPVLIDEMINYYLDNQPADYVSNTVRRTYPRGFDTEVLSFEALERTAKNARKPYQREHVTPFIYENMNGLHYVGADDSSRYRITVDSIEDFQLVNCIYELLYKKEQFGYREVVSLLDSRPDLVAINQFVEQKKV